MKIWMKITQDKFELPLVIADSSVELAMICNTTSDAIRSSVKRNGTKKFNTYVCVEIDRKDDEEHD